MGKVLGLRGRCSLFGYALFAIEDGLAARAGIKALDFPSPRRGEGAPRSGAGEGRLRHG